MVAVSLMAADFEFKDHDLASALQEIADSGNLNLIIGGDVQGKVNLILNQSDPLTALKLLCIIQKLHLAQVGKVYTVTTIPLDYYSRNLKLTYAEPGSVALVIEKSFPEVSATVIDQGSLWVRVPAAQLWDEIESLARSLDKAPKSVLIRLIMNQRITGGGRTSAERAELSLMVLEDNLGSISIGRDEFVEFWPFIVSEWRGYAMQVRCGRIHDDSVIVNFNWMMGAEESKNMGNTEIILKKGQETLIGELVAVQESSGHSIVLIPPNGEFKGFKRCSESTVKLYARADFE